MLYKLKPTRVYRTYLGGERLDRMQGVGEPTVSHFPEDWLSSVTAAFNPGREVESEGLSQTESGELLVDLISANPRAMLGKHEKMTLLFKLLDSAERLVIQVHPTVPFAKEHFNSDFGKTECWYFLRDEGYVYIGFKPGITRELWMELFERQDTDGMLDCLHRFDVKQGELVFVPGGVPHAIGAGCFLAELQEPSDLMVIPERVTPSGVALSDQKLHNGLGFERMFDCFVYEGLDREDARARYFKVPTRMDEGRSIIVDNTLTDLFRLERIDAAGRLTVDIDSYGIALVIEGAGVVNGITLHVGDRVFIPADENTLTIDGNLSMLVCQP